MSDKLSSDCLLSLKDYKDLCKIADAFIPQVRMVTETDLILETAACKMEDIDPVSVLPMYNCLLSVDTSYHESGNADDVINPTQPKIIVQQASVDVGTDLHDTSVRNANTSHLDGAVDENLHNISVLGVKMKDDLMGTVLLHDINDIDMKLFQGTDDSLRTYFRAVQDPGSGYILKDELLYRSTVVSGFEINQLFVPTDKRLQVIQLSHDSLYSGHYGVRKTIERIQTHFWWPKMRKDVQTYVKSCKLRQLRRKITVADRVPIKPVPRPRNNFQMVQIDLIGPIDPPSSAGHKYIISMIDLASKWVDSRPLKSLSAQEACDALLSMFNYTALPECLVCNNATNFVSELSQQMFSKLGIEVRHGVPGHSECQGAIERWNGNLKNLLHIVVNSDKPRDWHNKLPYLLFAYRTAPHSTTGLSPYQMVFGSIPRGPLGILSDAFIGKYKDGSKVTRTVAEHMANLEANLALGADIATHNSDKAQKEYVDQYNKRAFVKQFQVGQQVLILIPECSNRLLSQWMGPVTVTTKNFGFFV